MRTRIIVGTLVVVACIAALPASGFAGWDISISIPLPGFYYYYEAPMPPPAPPVPQAPPAAVEPGPVFYGGYWYRPSGGQWFISAEVGGPWYVIGFAQVPGPVLSIPLVRGGSGHRGGPAFKPRGWLKWGGDGHGRGHGHDD